MKLFNWEVKKTGVETKSYQPEINSKGTTLKEKFKGDVAIKEVKFPKNLGEAHPFNFKQTELLYKTYGFVTGVVDKYIDFIIGPGFFVKSDDEKAQQIIEKTMRDFNFDTLIRSWVKEALIKGSAFLEMSGKPEEEPTGYKILDSKWMFVKRNDKGEIEKFNQIKLNKRGRAVSGIDKNDFIEFDTHEIAFLPLNVVGDGVYGYGIVSPALATIDNLIGLSSNMHMLLHRKANAPIHAKIGNEEFMPNPSDVSGFGEKLETMHNKNEWATDWLVDLKVLDFGNIGDKFESALKFDEDMLFFSFQVPEVIMGRGSVPEGLAQVQMDGFERRILSLQSEIEKVIEQNIFKRILNANGLDSHVELEWGQPSSIETNIRIEKITELLKLPLLDFHLRGMLEQELAQLMGFNPKELESNEEERAREEETPVPIIPGQNRLEIMTNYGEVYLAEENASS